LLYRLSVANGQLETISGEIPEGLLRACRELVAEHLECSGTMIIREARQEPLRAEFRGTFSESFRQRVRNLLALYGAGQKIPERLQPPVLLFQVAIGEGGARIVTGNPPSSVMRFSEAFARANASSTARVCAFWEGGAPQLQFMGDMPPQAQERLRRHWRTELSGIQVPLEPRAPFRTRPNAPRVRGVFEALLRVLLSVGLAVGSFALLVFLGGGFRSRGPTVQPPSGNAAAMSVPVVGQMNLRQEEPSLQNGEQTEKRGRPGPHTFYVKNRESRGFLVRLVERGGDVRRAFYVGPGMTAEISGVPAGTYNVVLIQGRHFSRERGEFLSGASVSRLDEPIVFESGVGPAGERVTWRKGIVTRAPAGNIRRVAANPEWARK
jgi:hypothetical protein